MCSWCNLYSPPQPTGRISDENTWYLIILCKKIMRNINIKTINIKVQWTQFHEVLVLKQHLMGWNTPIFFLNRQNVTLSMSGKLFKKSLVLLLDDITSVTFNDLKFYMILRILNILIYKGLLLWELGWGQLPTVNVFCSWTICPNWHMVCFE